MPSNISTPEHLSLRVQLRLKWLAVPAFDRGLQRFDEQNLNGGPGAEPAERLDFQRRQGRRQHDPIAQQRRNPQQFHPEHPPKRAFECQFARNGSPNCRGRTPEHQQLKEPPKHGVLDDLKHLFELHSHRAAVEGQPEFNSLIRSELAFDDYGQHQEHPAG